MEGFGGIGGAPRCQVGFQGREFRGGDDELSDGDEVVDVGPASVPQPPAPTRGADPWDPTGPCLSGNISRTESVSTGHRKGNRGRPGPSPARGFVRSQRCRCGLTHTRVAALTFTRRRNWLRLYFIKKTFLNLHTWKQHTSTAVSLEKFIGCDHTAVLPVSLEMNLPHFAVPVRTAPSVCTA